jgi:copper chaperone CopZ
MLIRLVSLGLISLLVAVLSVSCGQNNEQSNSETSQAAAAANLKKVTLDVQGMTCSGCEYNVESALKKLDGVAKVKADYKENKAEVEFDPQIASVEELVETVNSIGYSAKAPNLN